MSQPLAHLYDLALRTLDDQDRRADGLRSRLGPVLAAAALGVALLSGPVIGGTHPRTVLGALAFVVAIAGLALTIGGTFRLLLTRHRPDAELEPLKLLDELGGGGLLDDEPHFYTLMITRFDDAQKRGRNTIERLTTAFTTMLCGILAMLCGLALATLVG